MLDRGHSHMEVNRSGGVGETVLHRRVRQLQMERQGVEPRGISVDLRSLRVPTLSG